jgi:hypothetical protein
MTKSPSNKPLLKRPPLLTLFTLKTKSSAHEPLGGNTGITYLTEFKDSNICLEHAVPMAIVFNTVNLFVSGFLF